MTKKEMLKVLIKDQIKKGVISPEKVQKQYDWRVKSMTKSQVEAWYNDVFK